MTRRFTFVTLALTAIVAFLVGAIFAGGGSGQSSVAAGPVKSVKTASKVAARRRPCRLSTSRTSSSASIRRS